jgi:hypothetical protein
VTFRHGDLPAAELAAWRTVVAAHTRDLAWIVSALPRSPLAQRAHAMLERLQR